MKLMEIIQRNVFSDNQIKMMSYAITIAEIYHNGTKFDTRVKPSYEAVVKNIEYLYEKIKEKYGIDVEHSEDDPYSGDAEMIKDIHKNKRLKVYTGHSDHPVFTPEQNVKFRAVHDVFSHYGPHKNNYNPDTGKISFKGYEFSYPGEIDAYYVHRKYSPKACHPAYFSEIIGQVSYAVTTGNFAEQKCIFFADADHYHIGHLKGKAQKRAAYIEQELKAGNDIKDSPIPVTFNGLMKNKGFTSKAGTEEAFIIIR